VRLQPFLQGRLIVRGKRRVDARSLRLFNQVRKLPFDERPCRLDAAVKVNGGDQRFVAVRDQRELPAPSGLFFAAAEDQKVAELNLLAEPGQRRRRHD
jgi:hypothetical protein